MTTEPVADAVAVVVRQAAHATFRSLITDRPTIMRVDAGVKRVRHARGECRTGAGSIGLLPACVPLEIENLPLPHGPYLASALVIPETAVDDLQAGTDEPIAEHGSSDPRALDAFERAFRGARDPSVPGPLRVHLAREVLLWLAEAGLRLPASAPRCLSDEVRARIAADPAAAWRADRLAASLATSAPTLRRRLASEGTSCAALLVDVRMTRALALLQATDRPVALVGESVGYASPSRFAARFRDRFGIAPARVRAGTAAGERIGTGFDRPGTPRASAPDEGSRSLVPSSRP